MIKILLALLPAILAPATAPVAGDVIVDLPMEARVSGTELTLGEIAIVTASDDAQREAIERVHLGYAPQPGYSRLFHAARLAQKIERATGIRVTLVGDRACRVWPVTHEIPATEISAVAGAEIDRLTVGLDVERALREATPGTLVPAGSQGYVLRARLEDDALRSGTMTVPVEILIDGELYRTVWTTFDVSIYESRTVLNRDVRAGERLDPQLFSQQRIRVAKVGAGNPPHLGGRQFVVGAVAARDLKSASLVTELDVQRPIAIKRNSSIFLQARKGAVAARVPAIARADGRLGDRILVETVAGGREVSAIVISKDMVEIDLGSFGGAR